MRTVAAIIALSFLATTSLTRGDHTAAAIFLSGMWVCVSVSGAKGAIVAAIEKRSAA